MLPPSASNSSPEEGSQFYRCPGCNEMVNGGEMSEVLKHHQHVLDPYRFLNLRAEVHAPVKPKPESNLKKARTLRH